MDEFIIKMDKFITNVHKIDDFINLSKVDDIVK